MKMHSTTYSFVALSLSAMFVTLMIGLYRHAIALNDSVEGPQPITIVPDLAFFYECPSSSDMMSDDLKLDTFLQKNGFTVEDTVEMQRELGTSQSHIQGIYAVDDQKRMINIVQAPNDYVDHQVTLQSEPPTIHAQKLEQDLQGFISGNLECRISYLARGNNPASSKGFYDQTFDASAVNIKEFHLRDLLVN